MENSEKSCCICGSKGTVFQVQEKWICEKCLYLGNEKQTALWRDSLEQLLAEYSEACHRCLNSEDSKDLIKAMVYGRKIQSVLQFVGVPKKHPLLLTIKKVMLYLKKIGEANSLLDEIEEQNEENKVNAEMIKFLSIEQKNINDQFAEILPYLLDDSFNSSAEAFLDKELRNYIYPFIKEDELGKYDTSLNQLIAAYNESVEGKGKTSAETIRILHKIRKRANSLCYIYDYLHETFGESSQDKKTYYIDIQRQINKVDNIRDLLVRLTTYRKKINAPKKEKSAARKKLRGKMELLMANVELHPALSTEG